MEQDLAEVSTYIQQPFGLIRTLAYSQTIPPSFETSSKMSLKKAIFDKNVLFKGHLTTGLGRLFATRTHKHLSNILFVDWEEKTSLESYFKV